MHIDTVCEGLKFPEGPIAMADGSVILVEMEGLSLVRISPRGDREVLTHIDGGPNGAAIGPDGGVYVTNNGGAFTFLVLDGNTVPGPPPHGHGAGGSIQRFDLRSKGLETLYTHHDGRPLISPNDLVFDRQGGMWFTDHGSMAPNGRVFGGIFYTQPEGAHIRKCRDGLISLNGIGLSPDEMMLYASDTFIGRLWAFDIVSPGVLAEPEPFGPGRALHNLQGIQYLDSLAVEAGGRICVGTILNGGIAVTGADRDVIEPLRHRMSSHGPTWRLAFGPNFRPWSRWT